MNNFPQPSDSAKRPLVRLRILAVLTLLLIALGSFVRATGAGLSCPDWPLCFGKALPMLAYGVAQEVIHRYVAGVVMLITLSLLWSGFRLGVRSALFRVSLLFFVLIVVQAIFGGLTVTMKLNPIVVTTHLALGTLFFQLISFAAFARAARPASIQPEKSVVRLRAAVVILSLATYLQILVGGFTAASGASLSCADFPLCGATVFSTSQFIQMTHRFLGLLIFLGLIAAVFSAGNLAEPLRASTRRMLGATAFLVALQVGLGWLNLHLMISPAVTVLHVVVAQTILLHLVQLWSSLRKPPAEFRAEGLPENPAANLSRAA